MKTPRALLFEKHSHIRPELDRIRESAVAAGCAARSRSPRAGSRPAWWERWSSFGLGWHLTGLGTAWLVILLLKLGSANSSPAPSISSGAPRSVPLTTAVREHKRQMAELLAPDSASASQPADPQQPRSEVGPRHFTV